MGQFSIVVGHKLDFTNYEKQKALPICFMLFRIKQRQRKIGYKINKNMGSTECVQ